MNMNIMRFIGSNILRKEMKVIGCLLQDKTNMTEMGRSSFDAAALHG